MLLLVLRVGLFRLRIQTNFSSQPSLSNSFRRVDAVRYSSTIEHISERLLDLNEYDSDVLLVYLVRLHSVVENIGQTLSYHDARARWNDKAPVHMHIQALEQALLKFREDIPPEILQNGSYTRISLSKMFLTPRR